MCDCTCEGCASCASNPGPTLTDEQRELLDYMLDTGRDTTRDGKLRCESVFKRGVYGDLELMRCTEAAKLRVLMKPAMIAACLSSAGRCSTVTCRRAACVASESSMIVLVPQPTTAAPIAPTVFIEAAVTAV